MQNTGNGVCRRMLWGDDDKKQSKIIKGILNLSSHNETVNYANALVANLLQ